MGSATEVILIPAIMILLGVFLKRKSILKEQDRKTLSDIVLYIALPSMIFLNLKEAKITPHMLLLPILGVILSFILLTIAYIYCRARNYPKKTAWTIMIATSIMNTGFIGYPVSLGVFGTEGFVNALFFDLSTSIMVVLYGMILAKEFGGDKKEALRSAVTFVPFWAMILGLIFNAYNLPIGYVVESILNYFAQATIPIIMIAIGLSLDYRNIKSYLTDSAVVSVFKLVLAPIIIFIILSLLKIRGMAFNIAILEAGMSTAGNALVLAITYNLDEDLMSSIIFTTVILSIVTLTIIISILTSGML